MLEKSWFLVAFGWIALEAGADDVLAEKAPKAKPHRLIRT